MFGRKILSLISVLFIGSQVISVINAETPVCRIKLTDSGSGSGIDGCEKGSPETGEVINCPDGYYAMFSTGANQNDQANDKTPSGTGRLIELSDSGSTCNIISSDVGYFVSAESGKYISRKSNGDVDLLNTVAKVGCSAGQITTEGEICISSGVSHNLENGNDYLITNAYSIFSETSSELVVAKFDDNTLLLDQSIDGADFCVDADKKIILDRKKEYCNGVNSDNCENYYTCTNGKSCTDTTEPSARGSNCDVDAGTYTSCNGYYLKSAEKNIYECTPGSCTKKTELIGYFVNAGTANHYIKCSATESNASVGGVELVENECVDVDEATLENACAEGQGVFGDLIKDMEGVKFCKDANNGILVSTAADYFIDANVDTTPFVYSAQGSSTNVLVQIGSGNVILSTKEGNYLEKLSNDALQTTKDGSGSLYVCTLTNGVSVCKADTKTLGYLINAGDTTTSTVPYIKCVRNSSVNSCTAIDVITSETTCTKAGEIVKDGLVYKICVFANTEAITGNTLTTEVISSVTETHFFVDATTTDPIFVNQAAGNGFYVIVDVKNGNVILNQDTVPKKYRYAIGSQVYLKGESSATTCNSSSHSTENTVLEYERKSAAGDNTGYYTKKV